MWPTPRAATSSEGDARKTRYHEATSVDLGAARSLVGVSRCLVHPEV